jgi:EAL domain-containing protein (putative c-di-GMP-specific phosphodiesterase class I)
LHELHATGVRLALDDFGAGHHVLANLQRLPIDFLKIDRSIVVSAENSQRDDALLGIYVDIGRALGVPVIAEGVETEAQAARLTELRCPLAQGYLFSRPLAPEAVPSGLSRQHAAPALPHPRSPEGAAESACQ